MTGRLPGTEPAADTGPAPQQPVRTPPGRTAATVRAVTRGRTPAVLIGGLLTGLVAGILALVLCLPLLQAGARAKSEAITTQGSGAAADGPAQGYVEKPTFTIAVGIDDEPVEMPAIQSAMTDHLAFSGEFADRLEQGAVAQDFATHEHTMNPEAAREQVADGTSVLAVILPEDLSPTFVRQAAEYGRGERSDPPDPVTLTIVAGPQALAQDEFILSQYRSQVLTQASEHIAEQMRIVLRKLNAEVDRPVSIVVEESDGPEPQDLLFASQSEAGSSGSSESTASSDSTYANAGPEAREAAVAEQTERSYAVGLTAVAAVAWAAAVLAAAVAVSTAVDRATGLGIVVVGPWRRRSAERPVPRALKLRTKALLMGLLVPLLAVAGTIGIRLAAGQEATAVDMELVSGGATVAASAALLVLLLAVGAALAAIVLAAAEVVGSFAAWVAAALALLWSAHASGLLFRTGAEQQPALTHLASGLGFFHTHSFTRATLLYNWVPGVVTAAALTVAVLIVAHLIVRGYDRRVSTRTALV